MKNHKATASLVGILVGIIIIIIGLCVQGISINAYRTDIGEDIKFGADFYTEIYAVTQDVGAAINSLKYTVATAVERVCDAIGWLIVSLGAIDVCFFAYKYILAACSKVSRNNTNIITDTPNLKVTMSADEIGSSEQVSSCAPQEISSDFATAQRSGEMNIRCNHCHRIQFRENKKCVQCGAVFTQIIEQ